MRKVTLKAPATLPGKSPIRPREVVRLKMPPRGTPAPSRRRSYIVNLPDDLRDAAERYCAEKEIRFSQLVEALILRELADFIEESECRWEAVPR